MITVLPVGQLGNQMFGYCMGKVLAERTGQSYVPTPGWRDKQGRRVTWTVPQYLFAEPTTGTRQATGREQRIRCGHWLDVESIDPDRPILLEFGYFQRYELFRDYKDKIRSEWLNIRRELPTTDPQAVYVHCRLNDYVEGRGGFRGKNCVSTTVDEYRECLKYFPDAKRLVICTDDIRSDFHDCWKRFGLPWLMSGGTWDSDFLLLASCRWLLMSQSTYSWWAGFLGRAERIVCPMAPGTCWHHGIGLYGPPRGTDYPNLYVDDEPDRWKWVT